jgi:hypothetical protein
MGPRILGAPLLLEANEPFRQLARGVVTHGGELTAAGLGIEVRGRDLAQTVAGGNETRPQGHGRKMVLGARSGSINRAQGEPSSPRSDSQNLAKSGK